MNYIQAVTVFGCVALSVYALLITIRLVQHEVAQRRMRPLYDAAFNQTFANWRAVAFTTERNHCEEERAVNKWCDEARERYFALLFRERNPLVWPFYIFRPVYTPEDVKAFSEPLTFENKQTTEAAA